MHRAVKIFAIEERASDSPFVEKVWRTRSVPYAAFISVAVTHWEIVVTRQRGRAYLTVRGPETKASFANIPEDAEFIGIQFRLGAFMPSLPVGPLVDRALTLPDVAGGFRLNDSAWDFPSYDNAETFVSRLVRRELLVSDAVVAAAVEGRALDLSTRTIQRRVLRATGLTLRTIARIDRAETAAELLDHGATILDTVAHTGYADQAHLTRSLKRFTGQTPGRIAAEAL